LSPTREPPAPKEIPDAHETGESPRRRRDPHPRDKPPWSLRPAPAPRRRREPCERGVCVSAPPKARAIT